MSDVKSQVVGEFSTLMEQAIDAVLDAQWEKADELIGGARDLLGKVSASIYMAHHVSGRVGSIKQEESKDGRRYCEEND